MRSCSIIQLSTNSTPSAFTAWPRLRRNKGFREAEGLGHPEWLGLLLDREASWRRDKRFTARLRYAKLRQQASIEDVDYRSPRGLDRALSISSPKANG